MMEFIRKATFIYFKPKDDNMGLTSCMINTISKLGDKDEEFSGYRLRLSNDKQYKNWYEFSQNYEAASIDEINVMLSKIREICKGVELVFAVEKIEAEEGQLYAPKIPVDPSLLK